MFVTYDPQADAMYIRFRDRRSPLHTREVHAHSLVDEDQDGVVGVELLFVSQGVALDGLPRAAELRELLRSLREIPQPV